LTIRIDYQGLRSAIFIDSERLARTPLQQGQGGQQRRGGGGLLAPSRGWLSGCRQP
jgi:hypothetical protein